MRGALLAACLMLAGCKRQSFAEAMHVICDAPRTVDAGSATELARILEQRVTNEEVRAG